jgi:hypothetical protein
MGKIAPSSAVTATAYLTELGRQYLFDNPSKPRYLNLEDGTTVDLLKMERFSLGDPDVNYNISVLLESGDVPDLSGENETDVKGAKGRELDNLISPGDAFLKVNADTVEYKVSREEIKFDLRNALSKIPGVVTQQLLTYIDGELYDDGKYIITPDNYGKIKLQNNELVIMLKEPTATQAGYRLRIFFPTVGSNYNKMTFQFERAGVPVTANVLRRNQTVVQPLPQRPIQ